MTIERFQSLVWSLANQMPVRYYLASFGIGKMCLQVYRFAAAVPIDELLRMELRDMGFTFHQATMDSEMWIIERTTNDNSRI